MPMKYGGARRPKPIKQAAAEATDQFIFFSVVSPSGLPPPLFFKLCPAEILVPQLPGRIQNREKYNENHGNS